MQTSSGEQFYMFVSLAIWLLNKLGNNLKQPQEYDDPNLTINSILECSAQLVRYTENIYNSKKNFLRLYIYIVGLGSY